MQVVRFNVAMKMVVCGSAEEPVFDQVRSVGQRALTSEVVEASQAPAMWAKGTKVSAEDNLCDEERP